MQHSCNSSELTTEEHHQGMDSAYQRIGIFQTKGKEKGLGTWPTEVLVSRALTQLHKEVRNHRLSDHRWESAKNYRGSAQHLPRRQTTTRGEKVWNFY